MCVSIRVPLLVLLWKLFLWSANIYWETTLCQALVLGSGNSAVNVMDIVPALMGLTFLWSNNTCDELSIVMGKKKCSIEGRSYHYSWSEWEEVCVVIPKNSFSLVSAEVTAAFSLRFALSGLFLRHSSCTCSHSPLPLPTSVSDIP